MKMIENKICDLKEWVDSPQKEDFKTWLKKKENEIQRYWRSISVSKKSGIASAKTVQYYAERIILVENQIETARKIIGWD